MLYDGWVEWLGWGKGRYDGLVMVGNAGLAGDFCIVSNNLWWCYLFR